MKSSSSSKNHSSFFRTGVSPGVRGTEGPKGQNTGPRAQAACPPLGRLGGRGGTFLRHLDLGGQQALDMPGVPAGPDPPPGSHSPPPF